ncbi:hypothetical protein AWF46_26225 [Escherichia coli]|nr:hypothetical protein AWF46_26225 [Escherichia coli]
MTGQRIGYIRVSTFDQNPERQLEGVKVDRAFSDKASGKDVKRPQLVLGSLAFMVVFLHWLTKPTKAAAGIGLANRKPCTVSQPACRNHARQSGVSTPSATTSIVVFRRRLH